MAVEDMEVIGRRLGGFRKDREGRGRSEGVGEGSVGCNLISGQ